MSRRRAIPGITQHMQTTQLRELESDGLVRCKIFAEVPPRVEYAITPVARALTSVIDAVFKCWRNHERSALGSKHREEQPTKLRSV
jgi:DNA-binding HxlR family transcriptional regulator